MNANFEKPSGFLSFVRQVVLCLLAGFGQPAWTQTTSGNAANGADYFAAYAFFTNPYGLGCVSCHAAGIARHANAINAGGHITHANNQGMGGAADPGGRFNDIAAYFATLFTGLPTQSVTFGTAKSIAIPNLYLNSGYGDYVGIRRIGGPSRGSAAFTVGSLTVIYTPNTGQCGPDSFTYQAYRTVNSGTSNTRTVSLDITDPPAPNISTSAGTITAMYGVAIADFVPVSSGGVPLSYAISAGTLPTGLSLNTTTGVIGGAPTPAALGTFNVTLSARNCLNGNLAGRSGTKAIVITIAKGPQAGLIASSSPPMLPFLSTGTLSAAGGSGVGAVTYATSDVNCTISGSTITGVAIGNCTVTATKAGDTYYNATSADVSISVVAANQAITFGAQTSPRSFIAGGAFAISPLAIGGASGNALTYSSTTTGICTVNATTVTMVSTGVCTIAADQAGNTGYNAAATVTQDVTINPVAPGAPMIVSALAGSMQATIAFSPPANNGGSPVLNYTATCGTSSVSQPASPITVGGLNNGMAYTCSVTATNTAGTGLPSGTVMVTPVAIAFIGNVASRKIHGAAGDKDLTINAMVPIGGAITVEPRAIGAGHRIVFQFNNTVTSVTSLSVVDAGMNAAGTASPSFNGNELIVTLTGVADNQRVTVTATGVNGALTVSASIGFLVGDVTNSRSVNAADISAVKARAGPTTNANFIFDLNVDGSINNADVSAVKARSGLVLP